MTREDNATDIGTTKLARLADRDGEDIAVLGPTDERVPGLGAERLEVGHRVRVAPHRLFFG